ncbi:MAG TPA: rhodanese-like domain-containing protein [Terracidiphilus sp.]|nr:rhodanese-like domain-containing protein [Terracidiphilus sp.]
MAVQKNQAQSAMTIPQSAQIQPAALEALLQSGAKNKPLVLQVGSRTLFDEAHIPGAKYAGPGAQPEGLARLEKAVAGLPHDARIVIYCGCCPWVHCPNIAPAFAKLRSLGFTHVQALYLAHNFGDDWVNAGYKVDRGA